MQLWGGSRGRKMSMLQGGMRAFAMTSATAVLRPIGRAMRLICLVAWLIVVGALPVLWVRSHWVCDMLSRTRSTDRVGWSVQSRYDLNSVNGVLCLGWYRKSQDYVIMA